MISRSVVILHTDSNVIMRWVFTIGFVLWDALVCYLLSCDCASLSLIALFLATVLQINECKYLEIAFSNDCENASYNYLFKLCLSETAAIELFYCERLLNKYDLFFIVSISWYSTRNRFFFCLDRLSILLSSWLSPTARQLTRCIRKLC